MRGPATTGRIARRHVSGAVRPAVAIDGGAASWRASLVAPHTFCLHLARSRWQLMINPSVTQGQQPPDVPVPGSSTPLVRHEVPQDGSPLPERNRDPAAALGTFLGGNDYRD
jgi:hypothetical protein